MESLMFWGKFMNAKFRCNIITFLKRKANLVIHMFWWFFSLWFKFWMKAQMAGWNFLGTWLWKKKTIEKVVRLVFCSLEKEEKNFLWNRNSWKNTKKFAPPCRYLWKLWHTTLPQPTSRDWQLPFLHVHWSCRMFWKKFWIHEIIFQFLSHK